MSISIDITFAIQIVTFFLLWMGLKILLFDPVVRVLDLREERTEGDQRTAERLSGDAGELQMQYEERIQAARRAAHEQSEQSRKRAAEEDRKIIAAARDAATAEMARSRSEIAAQLEQAREVLLARASALGEEVAERVVGRKTA